MDRTYAAELDADNIVLRVIVGTADWATEHLGGTWVDSPHKVGPGWRWVDGQMFPPLLENIDNDIIGGEFE